MGKILLTQKDEKEAEKGETALLLDGLDYWPLPASVDRCAGQLSKIT